jgi:WD40 repeat protein
LAFSPDGKLIASAAGQTGSDRPEHGEVLVWETATGKVLYRLEGHADRPLAVAFHPEGDRLATAGWDGDIKLWDLATGEEMLTLEGHKDAVMAIAFSSDGSLLTSGSLDKTVRLWKAD